jgi:hypothetical protein
MWKGWGVTAAAQIYGEECANSMLDRSRSEEEFWWPALLHGKEELVVAFLPGDLRWCGSRQVPGEFRTEEFEEFWYEGWSKNDVEKAACETAESTGGSLSDLVIVEFSKLAELSKREWELLRVAWLSAESGQFADDFMNAEVSRRVPAESVAS